MKQAILPQAISPVREVRHPVCNIPVYTGSFWTAQQRQMHPLHYTISYRASFKPELPAYFMRRYLKTKKARVLDPFGGRGTTTLEANLQGHKAIHNDRNPVSLFLIRARQSIPPIDELCSFLNSIPLDPTDSSLRSSRDNDRLLPFFHPYTLNEILQLRQMILEERKHSQTSVEAKLGYIALTALSRLHGHSGGFFSVYSFPQISILPQNQRKNNIRRGQKPEYRPIKERILKKMKADLSKPLPRHYSIVSKHNKYLREDARRLKGVRGNSVDLVITSPPFLDKVNYFDDNWMRAWFLGMEEGFERGELTVTSHLDEWLSFMEDVLKELGRVLKPGAHAVIEVGEVVHKKRTVFLEEELLSLLPLRLQNGSLRAKEVLINSQEFTKLANCWDVKNNRKGTNTNRCLVIQKI